MKRDTSMIKQGKTNFNYVTILLFNGLILLMGIGTRNTMYNPTIFKKIWRESDTRHSYKTKQL